jgi:2-polyprenyl-6-methoxyphenol hydroxylase-like FAD-dependent oxidoreductase
MRSLSLEASAMAPVNAEKPYLVTYRAMFGNAPRTDNFQPGETFETHAPHVSTQLFVGKERMWFFIYERLDTPTHERLSYSKEDAVAFAETKSDIPIAKGVLFRDIFAARNNAGLTNLEEGVQEHWSWNRIVLVGDAAHKVTPNLGLGYNSGVQDLVSLCNILRPELQAAKAGEDVSYQAIRAVFSEYQKERMDFMTKLFNISASVTRQSAWDSWFLKFMDTYVSTWFDIDWLLSRYILGPMISRIPVLNFLGEKHLRSGLIPWVFTSKS